MEQHNNQTHSELLTLLVDGQLEDSEATVLFSELAQNQDLRNELQEHLAIRESVHNDIEAYTTPLTLTQRVFASIGIDSSFINTSSGSFQNAYNKSFNLLKKFGPAAIAIILTSLITTYIVSNVYENKIDAIKSNIPVISSTVVNQQSTIPSANIETNTNSGIKNQVIKQSSQPVDNRTNSTVVFSDISRETQQIVASEVLPQIETTIDVSENINNLYLANINSAKSFSENRTPTINRHLRNAYIENFDFNNEFKTNVPRQYSLSIRGIAGQTFEGNHYGNQSVAMEINAAFGFLVSSGIIENLQFGFEVGKEPFHLSNVNIEEFLRDTDKDPNSPIFWGGILLRYDATSFAIPVINIYPWAQQLIGYSEHGPLSKTSIGMQYDIANMFSITVGAEYTLLRYQYNLSWYNTNRIGVTSGVILKF